MCQVIIPVFLVLSGAGQREVMEALFTLGKNLDNSSLACSFVAVVPMAQFAVLQMPVSICLLQLKFPVTNSSALYCHRPA